MCANPTDVTPTNASSAVPLIHASVTGEQAHEQQLPTAPLLSHDLQGA